MSPDLGLIPDAAQTDAHIFLVQGIGDGLGHGGLSRSGRSHQAEDGTLAPVGELPHRQELHHPFLHVFQSVVGFLQDPLGLLQVLGVLRAVVPGKSQQCLDVSGDHGALGRISVQVSQAVDLLADALLHLIGGLQLLQLFPVFVQVVGTLLPQLLPDHLHLLPQNVFSLIFINPCLQSFLKIPVDLQNLNLIGENGPQNLVLFLQRHRLQDLLPVLVGERQVYGHLADQFLHILDAQDLGHQLPADLSALHAVAVKQIPDASVHGFQQGRIHQGGVLLFKEGHLSLQVGGL